MDRLYSGYLLRRPEHWEHTRKFRPTMTMLDPFYGRRPADHIGDRAISEGYDIKARTAEDIIFGTVYLATETVGEIIDLTTDDFEYIM